MKIVREYDFTPNKLAQGLTKQETHIIALFIPDLSTPQYSLIIRSVEAVANQQGYQLILCNTDNDLEKEKTYLNLLEKNQVDGAIIVGGDLVDKNIVNTILRGDNIIVLINR
ncbi:MAG: LacI family transcriptional regulator, partial [Bacillota bacterium]